MIIPQELHELRTFSRRTLDWAYDIGYRATRRAEHRMRARGYRPGEDDAGLVKHVRLAV